jgi:DNA-binding NarL/FixJ family response regulator
MSDSENGQSKIRVLLAMSGAAAAQDLPKELCSHDGIELVGLARDGEDAMAQALEKRPDIAIVGQELSQDDPNWNASVLIQRIRWSAPWVGTILLSNNGARARVLDEQFGRADEVLSSSAGMDELLGLARRLMDRPE